MGSRTRKRKTKTQQNNLLQALDTNADSLFPVISWLLLWLLPKKEEEESPSSLGLNLQSAGFMLGGDVMEWLRSVQKPQMCTFAWLTSLWQPWLWTKTSGTPVRSRAVGSRGFPMEIRSGQGSGRGEDGSSLLLPQGSAEGTVWNPRSQCVAWFGDTGGTSWSKMHMWHCSWKVSMEQVGNNL